ncbi:MAG TPA: transglutaminase-like domain-containing protein [Chitinophagaceae bacterium]|nr:transglutaminase-like domain-containing protein [Chitinophagaceae bacterium]
MKLNFLLLPFISLCLLPVCSFTQSVPDNDLGVAFQLKKQFPDDEVGGAFVEEVFEFSRKKNNDQGPVVTASYNAIYDMISLRNKTAFQHYEFYNQFVNLTKYKYLSKSGTKFKTIALKAYDRSATGNDIFFDDNRVQFYNLNFSAMGEIARMEIEKEFIDARYLTRIFFQEHYPIKERVVKFIVPEWMLLDFKEVNMSGFKLQKRQEKDGKKTIYTFRAEKLEALKSEANSLGIAYTAPHILIVVKGFEYDGQKQKGFQTTEDLYRWYNFLYKKNTNDVSSIKQQVNQIIKGKTSDIDKVKALFYWVQDNIRYIAFEDGLAGFVPMSVQDVYKNKYGDCKGMANLLTEMLKLAGYDAHYTWIGTKHIPYDHSTAVLCVDNHCISTLNLGGKQYFLDATENYVPLGEYAYRIQGKEALIGKGDKYELKIVPVADKSASKLQTKASLVLSDNKVLKGHVTVTMTGSERTRFHQIYQELPVDKQKEALQHFLEFGNSNLTVNNVKTSDLTNREIPVVIEGDIDLSNNITKVGKELYASIDFFPKQLDAYMPDEKRKSDYEFNTTLFYEDEIELTAPAGYTFKDLPDIVKIENKDFGFNAAYTANKNKITLKKTLSINSGRINKTDFANWKDFLKKIKEFNDNQITIAGK